MFASVDDVAARLGRDLTAAEQETVTGLLEGVASEIAGVVGEDDAWVAALDPVPGELRSVSIEASVRVLVNPTGAQSVMEQLGSFQRSESWASGRVAGLELSASERRRVRRAVNGSVTAVTLESPFSGVDTSISDLLDGE